MRRGHGRPVTVTDDGCCLCCCYWDQDAERVAQRHLKHSAKRSLTGTLLCCDCDFIYERHILQRSYISCWILLTCLLLYTAWYAANEYTPARYLRDFHSTNCSVNSVEMNENTTALCYYDNGEDRQGWRRYQCLRVNVSVDLTDWRNQHLGTEAAVIADGYGTMRLYEIPAQCTTRPIYCSEYGDLETESREMRRYFQQVIGDDTFPCLYNPDILDEVLLPGDWDLDQARRHLYGLVGGLALLTCFLLYLWCTCGCQYIWAGRMPLAIQQQVQHQRANDQGQASRSGGSVVYVASAVQVAPVVQQSQVVLPLQGGQSVQHGYYLQAQQGVTYNHQGMPNQHTGMPNQYPGVPNQHQGMPNQQPGMPNQYPGMPNQYPGMPNQYPGMPNQQPGIPNAQPGMPNAPLQIPNAYPGMSYPQTGWIQPTQQWQYGQAGLQQGQAVYSTGGYPGSQTGYPPPGTYSPPPAYQLHEPEPGLPAKS